MDNGDDCLVVAADDDITVLGDEQFSNCSVFTCAMTGEFDWLDDWEGLLESSRHGYSAWCTLNGVL